jgi:hypothetical protein
MTLSTGCTGQQFNPIAIAVVGMALRLKHRFAIEDVRTLLESASDANVRFNDLRHTFITQMVEPGVPLGVIQSMVVHIRGGMLRHCTHVSTGVARKAVELLDAERPQFQIRSASEASRLRPHLDSGTEMILRVNQ